MKDVSKGQFVLVAHEKVWSAARAQGYVDGEVSRWRGKLPSKLAMVGIDDYCLGFRAGYFERRHPIAASPAEP